MNALISMLAVVAVWYCCLKISTLIVRPLLASRRLFVLLVVLLTFPLVFISVGAAISFFGGLYYSAGCGAILRQIGFATTWLWAIPIGTTLVSKWIKVHNSW